MMKTSIVTVIGIVCQFIIIGSTEGNPIVQNISPLLKLEIRPNTYTLTCTLESVIHSNTNVTLMWLGIIQGALVRIQPRDVTEQYHRNNSHLLEQTLKMNQLYDTYSTKHDIYIWCQVYYNNDSSGILLSSVYTIPKALEPCRNNGVESRGIKNKTLTSGNDHYRRGIVRRQTDDTTNSNQAGECSQGIIALLVVASASCIGAGAACTMTTALLLANLRKKVTVLRPRRYNNRYTKRPRLNTNSQLPLEVVNRGRESLPPHSTAHMPDPVHAYDTVSRDSSYMDMTNVWNGQGIDAGGNEGTYL